MPEPLAGSRSGHRSDMPEDQLRSMVGCVLASVFGVVTPLAWLLANGVMAYAIGKAPPGWTWLVLPLLGAPAGVLVGLLPGKLRARGQLVGPLIVVLAGALVVAGVALAHAFRWAR